MFLFHKLSSSPPLPYSICELCNERGEKIKSKSKGDSMKETHVLKNKHAGQTNVILKQAPGCSDSFIWSRLEGVSLTLCFVVWDWVKREAVMIFIGKASHTHTFFNLSISCSLPFTMRLIGDARSLGTGLESICQHNYMFSLVFIPLSLTNMVCIYITVSDNINKNIDLRESHLWK